MNGPPSLIIFSLLFLIAAAATVVLGGAGGTAPLDSVRCLKGVKNSLSDPKSRLSDWDFSNFSFESSVCGGFEGIRCWNEEDNRIIGISLGGFDVSGEFPSDVRYCSEITSLDLSQNVLYGAIPAVLCTWLPFLVDLDLSGNNFSGTIPPELGNCKFLNSLLLKGNQLSGSIPSELAKLDRLVTFSVADNSLAGTVPAGLDKFPKSSFDGNDALCGRPLGKCGAPSRTILVIAIASVVPVVTVLPLVAYIIRRRLLVRPTSGHGMEWSGDGEVGGDAGWVEKLKAHRLVQVTFFHKPIVRVRLANLLEAARGFDPANIISTGRWGTRYRATLRDGSELAIKRLIGCRLSDKDFSSEMRSLGKLRHPNLVPLLGFCIAGNERLLVYKHMPNGNLSSLLRGPCSAGHPLDWLERLRIGIGAARGLAWLHHGVHPPVVHHSLSSSTVLLDDDQDARITDVGLVNLAGDNDNFGESIYSVGGVGEIGYVAPEYYSGMTTPTLKGDVYSLGVVLLELVTGKNALGMVDGGDGFRGNLVDWVMHLSTTFKLGDAVDDMLVGNGHDDGVMEFMRIAVSCVSPRPRDRWSMYQVYESLKVIGDTHHVSDGDEEFPLLFGTDDQ